MAGENPPGRLLEVWIIDGGAPGRKGDVLQFQFTPAPYGLVGVPIEEGNLVVH